MHFARFIIDETFEDPDKMIVRSIEREAVFQTTLLGAACFDHTENMRQSLLTHARRNPHRAGQYDHAASAASFCALATASSIEPTM